MPTYGTATRANPRLGVLRGFKGNEPQSLSYSAKPKANEGILSGMLISLDSNGEWIKGVPAGKVPYVAYHDQADLTVSSIGLLLGLSCAGDYEVQTAFFLTSATIGGGVPLIPEVNGTAGGKGHLAVGQVKGTPVVTSMVDVVGFTTRAGKIDTANIDSNSTRDSAGKVQVLTWMTRWIPRTPAFELA